MKESTRTQLQAHTQYDFPFPLRIRFNNFAEHITINRGKVFLRLQLARHEKA